MDSFEQRSHAHSDERLPKKFPFGAEVGHAASRKTTRAYNGPGHWKECGSIGHVRHWQYDRVLLEQLFTTLSGFKKKNERQHTYCTDAIRINLANKASSTLIFKVRCSM